MKITLYKILIFSLSLSLSQAYPVIMQVLEGVERCVTFGIPEDEDAHIILLPLPNEGLLNDDKLLAWYVHQVNKLNIKREQYEPFAKQLPDEVPGSIATTKSEFFQKHHEAHKQSPLEVYINTAGESGQHEFKEVHIKTNFFEPTIINYVREKTGTNSESIRWEDLALMGYELCLMNTHEEEPVQTIMLIVIDGEAYKDDTEEEDDPNKFNKDKHLTPLEESLEESIEAANNVLREMRYMEKREARMRKTAESINSRIRWFSYLSISVLLAVTYIQVTYLKRYFKKKKLL